MITNNDYIYSYDRLRDDVTKWSAEAATRINAAGIQTIECKTFVESKSTSILVLSFDDFLKFCKSSHQSVVFIHYSPSDIDEHIEYYISEACEEEELVAHYIDLFKHEHSNALELARTVSEKFKYAELISAAHEVVVKSGVICEIYEEFIDLLSDFSESIESRQDQLRLAEQEAAAEEMQKLAVDLATDSSFLALKGKRKRCTYVQEKYGHRIVKSGHFRRPDMNSEYMDSNLVDLVEKVSDKIQIDNAMSSSNSTSESANP